jgi:endonuclease YncB( thermonuclease family)
MIRNRAQAVPRQYPVFVLGNHDGDTLTVDVDLGLHVTIHQTPLRLFGVNCPEMSSGAPGAAASAYTAQWLKDHPAPHTLVQAAGGRDKYGRLLGYLQAADGHVLNDDLLKAGQAVVMAGTQAH